MSSNYTLSVFRGMKEDDSLYCPSAFVTKLEALLRFAGVKHELLGGSPLSGPKRKIPYVHIVCPEQDVDETLGDTTFIYAELVRLGILKDLDAHLDAKERATAQAIKALVEDKLYWSLTQDRWVTDNYYNTRDIGPLSAIPYPIRVVIGYLRYRTISTLLYDMGLTRHSQAEIEQLRDMDLDALSVFVGDGSAGIFGKQLTTIDATVYGWISCVLMGRRFNVKSAEAIMKRPNLVAYANRINAEYFPLRKLD